MPALWPLFIPKAEDMFRWRVMLECGCVDEVLTRGRDRYPDQGSRGRGSAADEFWPPP